MNRINLECKYCSQYRRLDDRELIALFFNCGNTRLWFANGTKNGFICEKCQDIFKKQKGVNFDIKENYDSEKIRDRALYNSLNKNLITK